MPLQPKHPSQSSSQCAIDNNNTSDLSDFHSSDTPSNRRQTVPQSLVSPAFTPPSTPTPSSVLQPSLLLNTDTQHSDLRPSLLQNLPRVECVVRARIPTTSGSEIFLHLYKNDIDNKEHLAIVFGNDLRSKSLDFPREGETEMDRMIRGAYIGRLYPGRTTSMSMNVGLNKQGSTTAATSTDPPQPITTTSNPAPLVRIHSECYTGETAWSARCDCGEQLDEAARLMSIEGAGIVVYLRQEGRGIGLSEKLKAYNLQDLGNDTVTANLLLRHPADARSYGLATAILQDFNLSTIRLLTNNPEKVIAVEGPNQEILVTERVPMIPLAWKGLKGGVTGREVGEYLKTKANAPDPIRPWRGFPTDFENPDTTHGPSASRPWGGLIASVLFCELMILVFL